MSFRWEIILVPATILALISLTNRIQCSLSLEELLGGCGRSLSQNYLVVLGLAAVGLLLVIKHGGQK